ncbi:MAG: HAMP domain-containing protein, partial [Nostoc sp. C3-bin3]|nr:HAMP domain-containing protein [Nostoc sp. C3-bin3]
MVKQFDTTSNGDNQIPDRINSNGANPHRVGRTADPYSMLDVATNSPNPTPLAYVPAQTPGNYQKGSWWGRMSLKSKATALAIVIGVLPVVGMGVTNFVVTQQALRQEIIKDQQGKALEQALILKLLLGIGATTALSGVIATLLAKRAIEPILAATNAVKKLGQGDFSTRLMVEGSDELAVLGSNINVMAEQVQTLLEDQKAALERLQLFADVAAYSAREEDRAYAFDLVVQAAKKKLNVDRVVVYGFEPDFSGSMVA